MYIDFEKIVFGRALGGGKQRKFFQRHRLGFVRLFEPGQNKMLQVRALFRT